MSLGSETDDPDQDGKASDAQRPRRARAGGFEPRRLNRAQIAALLNQPIAAVGWHMCKGNEEFEQVMKTYLSGEELPPGHQGRIAQRADVGGGDRAALYCDRGEGTGAI